MSAMGSLGALSLVLLLSVMSPGPNFALVTSTAMQASRRAGLAMAIGLAFASATWVILAEVGFSLLLTPGSPAAVAVRVVGAAYLVWIGVKMVLGARRPLPAQADTGASSVWPALRKGYLVSITNPKSIAFYASVFTAAMPAQSPPWVESATQK